MRNGFIKNTVKPRYTERENDIMTYFKKSIIYYISPYKGKSVANLCHLVILLIHTCATPCFRLCYRYTPKGTLFKFYQPPQPFWGLCQMLTYGHPQSLTKETLDC